MLLFWRKWLFFDNFQIISQKLINSSANFSLTNSHLNKELLYIIGHQEKITIALKNGSEVSVAPAKRIQKIKAEI